MICPKCGNQIPVSGNLCGTCGADLTIYLKIMRLSNSYYNRGLEKAAIRDLSGAVQMLKKSLKMNKRNTNARNLLGLVYFEMGETVAALGEWVISKHFQPEDNWADEYMEQLQSSPTKLDAMNQAIRKYNLALEAAKQGGEDMAILQLKKVVSLNPNFIRARQLLALLYLHAEERERARKQLQKAAGIDVANTTTLRYQKEIEQPQAENSREEISEHVSSPAARMRQAGNYTEDKPNVMAWVSLVVGALVGILVTFILIVPTARKNIHAEYAREQLDYSSELRIKEAAITALDKEVELWKGRYQEVSDELAEMNHTEYDRQRYDGIFAVIRDYQTVTAEPEPQFDEVYSLAGRLWALEDIDFDNQDAAALYEEMKNEIYGLAAEPAYEYGREEHSAEQYEAAAEYLLSAYRYGYRTDYCVYYLARSYQWLNDYTQAALYYNLVLSDYPDSTLISYTRTRLSEMGMDAE